MTHIYPPPPPRPVPRRNRGLIVTLSVLGGVLGLCMFCGILGAFADSPKPRSTPAAAASAKSAAVVAPSPAGVSDVSRDAYLLTVRTRPAFAQTSDDALVKVGTAACVALGRGATPEDVGMILVTNGLPASDAGYLIGAAVVAFCPEHRGKVER